jgi:hypothetical protein
MPVLKSFPTLQPECHDSEARSLQKINNIEFQNSTALATISKPGGTEIALTSYVYGNSYQIPITSDLLDIGCYNPNDADVWVYLIISPGGPQPGMPPTFLFRAYGHNNAFYEAYTSHLAVPSGQRWDIVTSSSEATLTLSASVYLAIRHS